MVHPDYQDLVVDYDPQSISFSEVTGSFSSTSELDEEPEISELKLNLLLLQHRG